MDWFNNRSFFRRYQPLNNHNEDDKDTESQTSSTPFLPPSTPFTTSQSLSSAPIIWQLAAILFLSLNIAQFFLNRSRHPPGTFESGFATDFAPALGVVSTKKVLFEGSPLFYDNGTMDFPKPRGLRYAGEPSDEIDRNWNALTRKRYWVVSEEEARTAWGEGYKEFWDESTSNYIAGFDMQHTLHCLNFLRKAFHPARYPMSAVHGDVHRDHCIDHLRQLVMCYGDITPIPTKYRPGIGRNYVESNRWHTCRNTDAVLEWVGKRFEESKEKVSQASGGKAKLVDEFAGQ
ncbi:hypothetical protein BGZ60DRAFT_427425 [Tricladium varicosporioides]|nr:hypothetical protein BGZ60DRAFT_427425 [Hymenoscyphus varicosporioides]